MDGNGSVAARGFDGAGDLVGNAKEQGEQSARGGRTVRGQFALLNIRYGYPLDSTCHNL